MDDNMIVSVIIHWTKIDFTLSRKKYILFHFNIQEIHPLYVYVYKNNYKCPSIESNNAVMGLFGNIFFIFGLVDYFVIVIAVEPHLEIKGMDTVF